MQQCCPEWPRLPDVTGKISFICACVSKLNRTGSQLLYSTYLGGSGFDHGNGVAVDGSGNAHVTGSTSSTDFPRVNALEVFGGLGDAFVTKLNRTGSQLLYSTYLGGSRFEGGDRVAVDGSGNAYVAGETNSTDFPTVNALQPALRGGFDTFVTKLNRTGSQLLYSTYHGGSELDIADGIAVDGSGNAYVTGSTDSTDFPRVNALQPALRGVHGDAFVTKLNRTGSQLLYSTFLGGSEHDVPFGGIAVDALATPMSRGKPFRPTFRRRSMPCSLSSAATFSTPS